MAPAPQRNWWGWQGARGRGPRVWPGPRGAEGAGGERGPGAAAAAAGGAELRGRPAALGLRARPAPGPAWEAWR